MKFTRIIDNKRESSKFFWKAFFFVEDRVSYFLGLILGDSSFAEFFFGREFEGDIFLKGDLKKIIEKYNIETVVETGTYLASSTIAFSKMAKKVYSIELNDSFLKVSGLRTKKLSNIKLLLGSSPVVLRKLLHSIKGPVLFFLDAHWYKYWPILDELDAISEFTARKGSIIVIHDFFVPNSNYGYDIYKKEKLDLDYVKDNLEKINKDFKFSYNLKATGKKRGVLFVFV